MRPSFISGLVAVSTLALIGLVVVQYFWIGSSYDIKKEQFEQSVYGCLNRVYEDISDYEILMELREEDMPFPFRGGVTRKATKAELDTIIDARSKSYDQMVLLSPSEKYDYLMNARRDVERRRLPVPMFPEDFRDSARRSRQVQQRIDFSASYSSKMESMSVQVRELTTITDVESEEERRSRVDRVMRRLERANQSIDDRIDQETLAYILRGELQKADVDIPFEYAVLDASKKPVYRSSSYDENTPHQQFLGVLFPMDVATEPYVLNLYFPSQQSFIYRSIGLMATTSGLLIVVVMISFAITIMVIIRQKKWADMRTDFVNNITHELKTPIATISLASQMLGDTAIPKELKNYDRLSSVISHETKRLSTQVEKVLQMAIFERGTAKLNLKQIDLNELVEKVADTISLQVKNKGGQLLTHLDAISALVLADEIHFTNVVFNLCDNAIKYSNGSPDITLATFNEANFVVLRVKDKGIGIAKSDQKRIFEQFYRVQIGNVHNVKGFGLGLAYVKKVVDAHHGRMEVESELGHGTTFTIYIPQSTDI